MMKTSELNDRELEILYLTYHPVDWAELMIEPTSGIKLDTWQKDFLKDRSKRILLNCHRQSGKSTLVAIKALHRALFWDDQLIILVSPVLSQSSELFYKIKTFIKNVPQYRDRVNTNNELSLSFDNGSRIKTLPASNWNIRGSTANLIIIDEAAGVPDEIFEVLSPMLLTTNGQMIVLSTPRGKNGKYYGYYKDEAWKKYEVKVSNNPRMQTPDKAEFLLSELRQKGTRMYGQEYECEFLGNLDAGRVRRGWWQYYDINSLTDLMRQSIDIYISWDTASKDKEINDYTVGSVWLKINDDHYLMDMFYDKVLFPELVREVEKMNDKYHPTMNIIEDKASGIALIQQIHERRPNMNIYPYNPGKMDKSQRVDIATPYIEAGHVHLPARMVSGILVPTSIANDVVENMAEFPLGEHDDITDSITMYLNYHKSKKTYNVYFC